jgi:hypothetical protein
MYRSLDSARILETAERLQRRIGGAFALKAAVGGLL